MDSLAFQRPKLRPAKNKILQEKLCDSTLNTQYILKKCAVNRAHEICARGAFLMLSFPELHELVRDRGTCTDQRWEDLLECTVPLCNWLFGNKDNVIGQHFHSGGQGNVGHVTCI